MMTRSARFLASLFLLASVAACTAPADHPAFKDAEWPPLIQAHRFAYHGDVTGAYQLSPDGRKLAWIGPSLMRSTLFVRDNSSGKIRKYRARSADFRWTPDSRRLLYADDTSGAENTHVYMIDLADTGGEAVDLTPYPGVRASIHQIVPGDPDHVLVHHNRRNRRLRDLYRIDLNTRKEVMISQNPGDAVAAVTTSEGRVQHWQRSRAAQRPGQARRQPLVLRRPGLQVKPEETFRMLGASANRSFVWALSSRGRDRIALVAADPKFGWEKVVFEDPDADVSHVTMSRVSGNPLIAHSQPGYPRNEILDPALREDLQPLLDAQSDNSSAAGLGLGNGQGNELSLEIISMDNTERRLIVAITTSTQRAYYLVDRARRSFTLLAESVPKNMVQALAPTRPVTITSRDGLPLHGYLTLPRGVEPKRLPMVLRVHGGPWQRTGWGDPISSEDAAWAQFLANRGYLVLQVNFRGSSGYGHRFSAAGMGEFAGKMHEDLLDAVRWAVDAGSADPARVAIMGHSYGGYAALVGLTMTPKVFACGVSLAGPTDLVSLIESFPSYWKVDLSKWQDYVGDPAVPEDRADMTRRSPLTHAQALQRPVLIVQGAKDVRVRQDQAERMVDALRRAGKPVEYLMIPDMGHDIGWWAHKLVVLRATEEFLHRCLGGRASRFDPFDPVAWVWTRITR